MVPVPELVLAQARVQVLELAPGLVAVLALGPVLELELVLVVQRKKQAAATLPISIRLAVFSFYNLPYVIHHLRSRRRP